MLPGLTYALVHDMVWEWGTLLSGEHKQFEGVGLIGSIFLVLEHFGGFARFISRIVRILHVCICTYKPYTCMFEDI